MPSEAELNRYYTQAADRFNPKIPDERCDRTPGIGLTPSAAIKGYRILLRLSETVSEERVKNLKAPGADSDIHFTPALLSRHGAIEYVYPLVREAPEKYRFADQFNGETILNPDPAGPVAPPP